MIDCRRDELDKRSLLDRVNIIFATTNQISESLGDRLLNAGWISHEEYAESLRRVKETHKRHGAALVEMNLLSAEELFAAVRDQIEEIIWSIFAWETASVTFTPGRD